MSRPRRSRLLAFAAAAAATTLVACGEQEIQLAKDDKDYAGAKIFQQHCSGCHTLKAAGTQGSAVNANNREYKDGPNFNQRKETKDGILYAIENGGFSSGPMPQDIVVNGDAQKVADFVAKYSGKEVSTVPTPESTPQPSTPSG
jgi:mono/diheme cytochrome c family protein